MPATAARDNEKKLPREHPGRRFLRWLRPAAGEASLHAKLTLLISVAMVVGIGIGIVEARLGHQIWPLMLGLTVSLMFLCPLGQRWMISPLHQLLRQLERIAREGSSPRLLRRLPRKRGDEVGRLAECTHQFATEALQQQQEARALRRDMTYRVANSTQRAASQWRRMAHRDALTELGNRRYLNEMLPDLFKRAEQAQADVLCIQLDLDNFKQINDTLGHAKGDQALQCLAQLIDASVRPGDLAVRLGGDEFALFLPGAGLDRAAQLTDRLRAMFRQQICNVISQDCGADLSIGVASRCREHCADGHALLQKADEHLYKAKHSGKGRTYGVDEPVAHPESPLARRLPE